MATFFGALIKAKIASKMGEKATGMISGIGKDHGSGVMSQLGEMAGNLPGGGPQPMGQMQGGAAGDPGGEAAAQQVLSQTQMGGPTRSNMGGLMMNSVRNPYMNREEPNWRYRSY
jgi:hypothetical protein